MASPQVSIVVAVSPGADGLGHWLEALGRVDPATTELLFCVAGAPPAALTDLPAGAAVVAGAADSLVPHLWADGFRAARGSAVAVTTDSFAPRPPWFDAVRAADLTAWAAVGGTIECASARDAVRWAIFFLRYIRFAPPMTRHAVAEVAADNAVYRRSEVMRHPDLLARGFWEPSFHARFRGAGLRLALDPDLESLFCGTERPAAFVRHRFAHGREFGRTRARGARPARRLAYLAASPLVPVVLLARIAGAAVRRRHYRWPLLIALPWLTIFCLAWSLGECRGTLDALRLLK